VFGYPLVWVRSSVLAVDAYDIIVEVTIGEKPIGDTALARHVGAEESPP